MVTSTDFILLATLGLYRSCAYKSGWINWENGWLTTVLTTHKHLKLFFFKKKKPLLTNFIFLFDTVQRLYVRVIVDYADTMSV